MRDLEALRKHLVDLNKRNPYGILDMDQAERNDLMAWYTDLMVYLKAFPDTHKGVQESIQLLIDPGWFQGARDHIERARRHYNDTARRYEWVLLDPMYRSDTTMKNLGKEITQQATAPAKGAMEEIEATTGIPTSILIVGLVGLYIVLEKGRR